MICPSRALFEPEPGVEGCEPGARCPRATERLAMSDLYPHWAVTVAWLLTVAVAAVIYFVPVTRLVDGLNDRVTPVTATE